MNSKNLYFTIFSLILLGFISSCAENSNKCSPSYASNIEQLNEKLYVLLSLNLQRNYLIIN